MKVYYFISFVIYQGDLGAIDEKYDVAVSTAVGALDNIVTDTVETAQECIKFLKRNNLGYTTFIMIDKVCLFNFYSFKTLAKFKQ